ncbi:MAG: tetratricopeptide repeat protein [Alistipes sp.]|nr:tetratricopeptide repeat protein [Alistipes sp.]
MCRKIILTLIAALLAASLPAGASSPESRVVAERARSLYEAKRWSDARSEYVRLRDMLDPTRDLHQLQRTDYFITQCMVQMGSPDAEAALRRFLDENPSSVYCNDARFALACYLCDNGDPAAADEEFAGVDYRLLDASQRERYDVRVGYIRLKQGRLAESASHFSNISAKSDYSDHAVYYRAYIDYKQGRYDSAYDGFRSIERSAAYAPVIPYYLVQIEYRRGNYAYVVDKGEALLKDASADLRSDLVRVVAESWFHLDDYAQAVRYMTMYPAEDMGREEYYILGYSLYRLARYNEARAALERVCGADDALTQNASYHLADCYVRSGDKARAADAFAMASNTDLDGSIAEDALFNYGKLKYELGGGLFNEAINVLNSYLALYPSSERSDEARTLLIAAYYNSRDYDAAYDAIKAFPTGDGEILTVLQKITYFRGLEAFERGDLAAAKRYMDESVEVGASPKYTALGTFWQGEIAYSMGDRERAESLYEAYMRRAPRNEREYAMARYNIGYCRFDERDMEHAARAFADFLKIYPARDNYYYDAQNRLGDARYSLREFADALSAYDVSAASEQQPRYYAQWQRALVYGIQSKTDRKIAALKSIIDADRGDYVDDAWYELGRTYIAQERYSDGVKTLETFVEQLPHSPYYRQALSDLGLAYYNLGDKTRSREYYQRVVAEAPQSPEALEAMRGIREIYVSEGNVDDYFAYAERSGMESDMSLAARDSLSFAAAKTAYLDGDGSAAGKLASYLTAYPKGYYTDDALFYLSDCYVRSNERARAVETMSRLVDRGQTQYTHRVLGVLAPMAFDEGDYGRAASSYMALYDMATEAGARSAAAEGYVNAVLAAGNDDAAIEMADRVNAMADAGDRARRVSQMAKAKILRARGDGNAAMRIFERLAADPASREGAESYYYTIEARLQSGDSSGAEKMIYQFSSTPYAYWRAKAFLLLGDIYVAEGNTFQARATYQSIVDGYSPADDGIVDEARDRISTLKD